MIEQAKAIQALTPAQPFTFSDWWGHGEGQLWLRVRWQEGFWHDVEDGEPVRWWSPRWVWRHRYFPRPEFSGRLPDLWYYWRCRLWTRHHVITVKTLPPTWQDADEQMLHVNFHLLGSVIFNEDFFGRFDTDGDPSVEGSSAWLGQEMRTLWEWWTITRPARDTAASALTMRWHESHCADLNAYTAQCPNWRLTDNPRLQRFFPDDDEWEGAETKQLWNELRTSPLSSESRDAEDDAMLIRLMKIRRLLWT